MASAKKLPSGNWRVNLFTGYDENKKRTFKSFTAETKKEAEYLAAEYKMFQKEKSKPLNMTVEDAMQKYIDSKTNILSPSTIHNYKIIKDNRMESLKQIKLNELTQEKIQNAVNEDAKKLSRKTLANTFGLLSSTLKMFYPDFRYEITLPAKKKVIKELPHADDVFIAIHNSNIELPVLLAMWLGLRLSEIKGLKYSDINNGVLTVQRAMLKVGNDYIVNENTKTYDSTRTIKLPEYLKTLIGDGRNDDFIVKETGSMIYKRFKKLLSARDVQSIRFHDLRHINASVMLQLGIPDKYAMERGGWSSVKTMKGVYQHTFSSEREIVDTKIDDYFNKIQHEIQHEK